MAFRFSRVVVVPMWMAAFILFALLAPSSGLAMRIGLFAGLVLAGWVLLRAISTIRALLRHTGRRHVPTVEVLPAVDDDVPHIAPVPAIVLSAGAHAFSTAEWAEARRMRDGPVDATGIMRMDSDKG